jgi:hypothetical protein
MFLLTRGYVYVFVYSYVLLERLADTLGRVSDLFFDTVSDGCVFFLLCIYSGQACFCCFCFC